MQSPHQIMLASALLLTLSGCGLGEVDQEDATELAAEFEAGANNAADETQADVLRERANSLREVTEGNEAAKDQVISLDCCSWEDSSTSAALLFGAGW